MLRCRAQLFEGASAFDGKLEWPIASQCFASRPTALPNVSANARHDGRKPDIAAVIVERGPIGGADAGSAVQPGKRATMEKGDIICPKCGAGFRRITLSSLTGEAGEFRCSICDHLLEVFDGSRAVVYRLTVAPSRTLA
ncbi:MJ0042-type zinc finger domain-containing protein [Bradyrhizobium sp. Cp5.3]|uniref:MJ0042-type zinc finger domain-containing protein n=1 Tax=Bradyrhizobium sp. Cp5.3 TaxID=443598 RepID=UPI001FD9E834|nr:MJ0042-type zinc finger domain-containing protein [Bradyrhizobium sp. Cp5.3]